MKIIIFSLLSFFIGFTANANEIEVVLIKGKVNYIRNNKTLKLTQNIKLQNGDIIQTTKKSFVRINLYKSVVTIAPNSYYKVANSKKDNETSIGTLLYGHLHAAFEKDPKSRRVIKTKTSALGIRGTKILLHVARDKKEYWERYKGKVHPLPKLEEITNNTYSQICCIEGLVDVKTKNGTEKSLKEGQIMTFNSTGKNVNYRNQIKEVLLKSSKAFGFEF